MGKKRKEAGKKTTPEVNVVRRNSNQMNPSLFLPFPLPKTHQAHPVSLSEDGLVMVFYRADGTKMCNPRTPRDLRDGDIESDLKMKATLWRQSLFQDTRSPLMWHQSNPTQVRGKAVLVERERKKTINVSLMGRKTGFLLSDQLMLSRKEKKRGLKSQFSINSPISNPILFAFSTTIDRKTDVMSPV